MINKLSLPLMPLWASIRWAAGDATSQTDSTLHQPGTSPLKSSLLLKGCAHSFNYTVTVSSHAARVGLKQALTNTQQHKGSYSWCSHLQTSRAWREDKLLTPPKHCQREHQVCFAGSYLKLCHNPFVIWVETSPRGGTFLTLVTCICSCVSHGCSLREGSML